LELIKAINVPEEIAADDHKKELYSMIARLSIIDRSIIMLWLDEKSYAEIAETLGISETNVGSRLNRAKDKLKQMFNHVFVLYDNDFKSKENHGFIFGKRMADEFDIIMLLIPEEYQTKDPSDFCRKYGRKETNRV
jgi:DNA-binding CsgD family transcriptional regulator